MNKLALNAIKTSVKLNKTYVHTINNFGFDNIPKHIISELYKDGRYFSHVSEQWIEENYPLRTIYGCQKFDFQDIKYPETFYEAKTFTKYGCNFRSSFMKGTGRVFNDNLFQIHTKNAVFCIISNVNFPEIRVKFISGVDLLKLYPSGIISYNHYYNFFY